MQNKDIIGDDGELCSAVIGRKEDLEEERREAEMIQRKLEKKKMKSHR